MRQVYLYNALQHKHIYVQINDSGINLIGEQNTTDTSKFYHNGSGCTNHRYKQVKYIDGDLQTSLATTNYPSLNAGLAQIKHQDR